MDNTCHKIRESRYSYDSPTYLLTPFAPWALSLKLDSVNISKTGICTILDLESFDKSITVTDLDLFLCINDPFQLQIESNFDHLDSPTVMSRLVRKNIFGNKLELSFSYEEMPEELLGLTLEFGTLWDRGM